jgi:release factor glutamine methyltransferase
MADNLMAEPLLEYLRSHLETQVDQPEETPESTLRALYFKAAGRPVSAAKALTLPIPEISAKTMEQLTELVRLRCNGTPLAHLTGRQQFMGVEMLAGPRALIPRVETELVGYEALACARSLRKRAPLTILDLCTGSGNLILGVLAHEAQVQGYAADISPEAIQFARENAEFLGLSLRVEFYSGNLFEPFESESFYHRADIIICNPPYFSTGKIKEVHEGRLKHEPYLAFDGGPYGTDILRRVIREAPKFLKPQSYLCLEVGLGQGPSVEFLLKRRGEYAEIRSIQDKAQQVRGFVART